jgi:uncharacterized protein YqgC (DUF456 family)
MSKPLFEEIKQFQKDKKKLVPALILLGVLGIFLPVIPGFAALALAFLLVFPRQSEKFIKKVRTSLNL